MKTNNAVYFAPQLFIPHGITDISFYEKAFGAKELRKFVNEDDSIHVSELAIDGVLFHLHEEVELHGTFAPDTQKGTTVTIGLFVPDVDVVMEKAVEAGAKVVSEAKDYDYGYRQGEVKDPFGHCWLIEKKI